MVSLSMIASTKRAVFSFFKKGASLVTTFTLVFGSFAFVLPTNASALDTVLYPVANGTYTAWTNDFDEVNESSNFGCSSNYILGSDINTRESYVVDLSGVPDGSTITSIAVRTYSSNHNQGNKNGEYRTLVRLNGVDSLSTGSPVNPVDNCDDYANTIDVTDTVKSNATTLEIGVEKQNASSAGSVRVGAIHATITYSAPVIQDACGAQTTYSDKSNDFSDSRVSIDFQDSDKQITINPQAGYKLVSVHLDVDGDGVGGYVIHTGSFPGTYNPSGNDTISKAKVVVVKNCATLTLVKTITNDNNGSATATDWTLVASSTNTSTKISGVTAAPAVTATTVAVGTYNLSEINGPTGYTGGAWACTDGTLVGSTLTLVAGDSATCTINNNDDVPPPTEDTLPACTDGQDNDSDTQIDLADEGCAAFTPKINVTKSIVNTGGGTATPLAFSYKVNNGSSLNFAADGSSAPVVVTPGAFSVTEDLSPSYNASYSAECSGTIAAGETKNCTITNTYIPQVPPPAPACDAILSSDTIVSSGGELVDDGPATAVETWEHDAWLDESADGAKWIWSTAEVIDPAVDEAHTFTETFNVVGTPTGGSLSIAADNGYEVTLNGNAVCSSNTSDPHYAAYEVCPIPAASFNSGPNTLVVKTTNLQYATQDPHTNPAGVIYKLTVNKNACIPAPTKATVTMCKVDQNNAPLSGWTLTLKGANVEDVNVPANLITGVNTVANLTSGVSYIATAVGIWLNDREPDNHVDAEYSTEDGWTTQMDGFTGFSNNILELQINGAFGNWGAYNNAHTYARSFTGTGAQGVLGIFDGVDPTADPAWYGDNSGSLNVNISTGYAGITGENGCVVFENVPVGTYTAGEIMKDGWTNVSGLGDVVVDAATETFTVKNSNVQNFNIKVTKYTCAADTVVSREANGPDATGAHTAPQGCTATSGVKFGYFHYAGQTTGNSPYAYLENFAATAQSTDGGGVTTFSVPQEGRYDIAELDSTGDRVQDIDDLSDTGATNIVLGLYCNTDGGTSTDNLDYVIAGQIEDGQADCVVYNVEAPRQCNANATKQIVSSAATVNGVVLTFNHASWVDETLIDPLAKWIWSEDGVNDPLVNETEVFNDTFTIVGTPLTDATLTLAADNQYAVSVNGNPVAGCSSAGEFNYGATTTCNVPLSMLVNGANTIAFTVTNMGLSGSSAELNPAGVVYELVYTENECEVPPPPTQCVADQELFTNGSFEANAVTNAAGWDIFASGTPNLSWIAAWFGGSTSFGDATRPEIANVELQKDGLNGWTTPYGAQWTELDSDWNGHVGALNGEPGAVTIAQTIATAVGKTYSVTYSFSPRPGTAASENAIEVLANGVVIDTVGPTAGAGNTVWSNETAGFVATTTSTIISFRDAGTPNNSAGSLLDNVSVMCVPVVPPPVDVCTDIQGDQSSIPTGYHAGEVANTCEMDTPTPTTGTLTIVKVVSGGDGTFGFEIEEVEEGEGYFSTLNLTTIAGNSTSSDPITLNPGTYEVTEIHTGDWILSGSSCSYEGGGEGESIANGEEIYVTAGSNIVCTFTNTYNGGGDDDTPTPPPTITTFGGGNGPIWTGTPGQVLGVSTTLPELPAGCDALIHTYMRKGKKNDPAEVKLLQEFLNTHMQANLPVTGVFGPATDRAVRAFQQKYADEVLTPWGLNGPTGFVYRTTQRWVNLMHCKDLNIPMPTNLIPYHNEDQ